jgi:general secretion pathway protein A
MEYYSILNLHKEPFSNSPDPEFFFQSRQHLLCLQKLEIAVRLKRGLNVVIGDVGTGKTTMCRQLIRQFGEEAETDTFLILDPAFGTQEELLKAVAAFFQEEGPPDGANAYQFKEFIQKAIFRRGVDQQRKLVLIIDEGQRLPPFALEILREFLNFETNENKLLQIIVFAQREFEKVLADHENFADRINLYHQLEPLSFKDTRLMIQYRLQQASRQRRSTPALFTLPALWTLYRASGGYPRKIIHLCHRCVLTMIIQNRKRVSGGIVRTCIRHSYQRDQPRSLKRAAVLAALLLAAVAAWVFSPQLFQSAPSLSTTAAVAVSVDDGRDAPGRQPDVAAPSAAAEQAAAAPAHAPPADSPSETTAAAAAAAQADGVSAVPAGGGPVDTGATGEAETAQAGGDGPVAMLAATHTATDPDPAPTPPQAAGLRLSDPPGPDTEPAPTGLDPPPIPPRILGSVTVQRNEVLSWLITKVYGSFTSRRLRSVLQHNPQIKDPDNLVAGSVVYFPALPQKYRAAFEPAWWVVVAETRKLGDGLDYLRGYPRNKPPLRLIPYWNSEKGLLFRVLIREVFTDVNSARQQRAKLPEALSESSRVTDGWPAGWTLYADPFLG